jgi:hypothetical protein
VSLELLQQMVQRVLDSQRETREDVREIKTRLGRLESDVVWIVNPKRREISVYRSPSDVAVMGAGAILREERFLPGLELPVSAVFASPGGPPRLQAVWTRAGKTSETKQPATRSLVPACRPIALHHECH